MNRRVVINLAFFTAVFAIMLVWAARNLVTVEALERPYSIQAEFEAASGVLARSEVAYLGVGFGYVDRVERTPDGVLVTIKMDRDRRIPAGSTAHIFRKSAVGEPFIDFAPPAGGAADGAFIEPGEVVPRERTTIPIEFSELLRAAGDLLSGVSPERTGVLVEELAAALRGRGEDLRRLAQAGDTLSSTFAERTEVLDRLAVNSTRLTRVMAEHRESLGQSITDLRQVAETLRRARNDTAVLLDRGSRTMGLTADLVSAQLTNLDCILSDLELVIDETTTPERLAGLRTLLQVGPRAYGQAFSTRDIEPDGVWVRVGLIMNPENPPPQYIPPRELPAVPPVPPCGSTLEAAASGLQPSAAPPSTPLPATGGTLAALLGLALLAAAVVVHLSGLRRVS